MKEGSATAPEKFKMWHWGMFYFYKGQPCRKKYSLPKFRCTIHLGQFMMRISP